MCGYRGNAAAKPRGVIRLLPALPDEWKSGEFTGLCARGGFTADAVWHNGAVTSLKVSTQIGGECEIVYPTADGEKAVKVKLSAGRSALLFACETSI